MNSNIAYTPMVYTQNGMPVVSTNGEDDRIFGGFFGPFILGGITGGLLAPAFNGSGYGGYGRPSYYNSYNNYYYPPYYYPYSTYYY